MLIYNFALTFLNFLDSILDFELPSFPPSVQTNLNTALHYLSDGFGILNIFVSYSTLQYIFTLFKIIFALDAAYFLYSVVFWVLRKIPFTSIRT